MAYTEIKERSKKRYFYRVLSIRNGKRVSKKRIYLGANLDKKRLELMEKEADKKLNINEAKKKLVEKIKAKIIKILKKNNIKKAGIFGSYARGEAGKDSDIDILVEPAKGMGLKFIGMNLELEEKLGKKVHLVTYKFINPYMKKKILKDEVKII